MSQPPQRPWFRLASMVRPAPPPPQRPPTPAPVQPQPFRPQVPLTQAVPQATPRPPAPFLPTIVTPRASAPPSPIPTPIAPQPTAPPPSPPSKEPPPAATITDQSPKSPAKTPAPSVIRSPPTTFSAQSPTPPTSLVTKTSPSSSPASPGQNASTQITVTRPAEISYSSPKPSASSAPPPSPLLSTTPAFRTVPSSPVPPTLSPVTNSVTIPKVAGRATTATISAMASPKVDKPWVESPPQPTHREKILSYPPSPLALPPPAAQMKAGSDQLEPIPAEIEQKTVLMHEKERKASNGYVMRSSHSEMSKDNSVGAQLQAKLREGRKGKVMNAQKKQNSDSEEYGSRVLILAGENKGAIMELSPSRKKNGSGSWSNRGQKLEEGISKKKDEKEQGWGTETVPIDAFVNCNVQGVNNSILYHCSCTHNDPGVHLALSRKTNGGGHGVHH